MAWIDTDTLGLIEPAVNVDVVLDPALVLVDRGQGMVMRVCHSYTSTASCTASPSESNGPWGMLSLGEYPGIQYQKYQPDSLMVC